MPISSNNTDSLKLYRASTKFGFLAYVMAADVHEARELAVKDAPISPCHPDWVAVSQIGEITLTEVG